MRDPPHTLLRMSMAAVMEVEVGSRVSVKEKLGTVRFVGTADFAAGKWIGVELDVPEGKNSGAVQGIQYFECRENHGLFVRQSQVSAYSHCQIA